MLPNDLLLQIQKYAEGCLLYIPNRPGERRNWGESTGAKGLTGERNRRMIRDHQAGLSVREIALRYHLAESTVKKIIYRR